MGLLTKLTIAAIIAAGVWFFMPDAPGKPGNAYKFEPGEKLYSYDAESKSKLYIFGSEQVSDVKIHAVIKFRVYETKKESVKAGFYPVSTAVLNNGSGDRLLEYLYSIPVLVTLSSEGRFLDIKFPANTSEDQKKALRGFYSQFEMVLKPQNNYFETQQDSSGTFEAEYAVQDKGFVRVKKRYSSVFAGSDENTVADISVESSHAEFVPSKGLWLKSVRTREKTVYYKPDKKPAAESFLTTEISENASGDFGSTIIDQNNYEQTEKIFASGFKIYKEKQQEKQAVSADPYKFERLLNGLGEKGRRDVSLAMRSYLLANPEVIESLPESIRKGAYSDAQTMELIKILGIVSITEAQNAIYRIASDPGQSETNRLRAVIAAGSITMPLTSELESYLVGRLDAFSRNGAKDTDISAILAVGAAAGSIKENFSLEAKEISGKLADKLGGADSLRKKYILKSLGNTKDSGNTETIADYLSDSDPAVRQAAAESLMFINDNKAEQRLVSSLDAETDPQVRAALYDGISGDGISKESAEAVSKQALRETDPDARRSAIKLMSENIKDYPEFRDVLLEMLKTEKSGANTERIIKAVGRAY